MEMYNATVRFMAGYDEATGAHCFLDLTPMSVRRSGVTAGAFVQAVTSTNTLEALRGIVSHAGDRPVSRYSQPGNSYVFDSPENVSDSVDLFVSQDNQNAIWSMDNKFIDARFGFFVGSEETTLGQLRIPAYGAMNVVVACVTGLFTVVVGGSDPAGITTVWGNRGYAATFNVPSVIANGSNTVGWGARATSKPSPYDTTNGRQNYLSRPRSVVADVVSGVAKEPSLSDVTLNVFSAQTPCYLWCPDASGLASVECSSLSSVCRFPVRVNKRGRYYSGTSLFTCDDSAVNSLTATFARNTAQPSFTGGPVDITYQPFTTAINAAPSACFIGSHVFTPIAGMNAAWKCETLPSNRPTFFYYLYGAYDLTEPTAKVTYEYGIVGGHMIAEQVGGIELFINVLMGITVTTETYGQPSTSSVFTSSIRIALNWLAKDDIVFAGPTHLVGLSLNWSRP
jgi:hypothetical protein